MHAATCEGKSPPLPLFIFLSFTLSHWAWRAPWFACCTEMSADLSVRKEKARVYEWPSQSVLLRRGGWRERRKGSKVGTTQEKAVWEGQNWRGRENGLHSQKPLKFDFPTPHSLNKSTCRSLSPFLLGVRVPPTPPLQPPTLSLALSFPLALTCQNCEFWQGFANMENSCSSCHSLHNL